ncbi:MAG: tyrosine-type recombinase/integrase [Chloroflexaceae bacterium]|nr:tyrosine-type recombinase/integrase [Chloroflexaceae bacterium]
MDHQLELFLAYMQNERSISDNTMAAYRNDLAQCREFMVERGITAWTDVGADDMQAFSLYLRERSYAHSTIARRTAAVRSFYTFLKQGGYIQYDPSDQLDVLRVARRSPQSITPTQVDALLELPMRSSKGSVSPEGMRDRAMLELLYATGMRVSELVALNLDDLDLPSKQVRCIGSRERQRILPLDDCESTLTALEEYFDIARPQLCRNATSPEAAIFLNHRGKRLTRQGFWLILTNYAREIALPDLTPHTLRHSFAVHKLRKGEHIKDVQRLLGHASISTTQIYKATVNAAPPDPPTRMNGNHADPADTVFPMPSDRPPEAAEPQE